MSTKKLSTQATDIRADQLYVLDHVHNYSLTDTDAHFIGGFLPLCRANMVHVSLVMKGAG